MRYVSWWLAGTALLTALGCSGGGSSPLAPAAPTAGSTPNPVATLSASGSLGSPMIQGDITTSALAIYTLQIDPATLQATSSLKETRSGQANDDIYMLSIDSFLTASSFGVVGISGTATTLDVEYQVTHPFPAPSNPTGTPNGSTNRADLGIAGMVLFLADVPSATGNTYFTDKVANTALIANADAYYAPGGLLSVTGNANTFPYRLLVDELADSRKDISNSGNVTGNFGADGWTRSEFGPTNDGWTGYGVLHQGQTSVGTMSLDLDELALGFSLDVGIIAKYNDPRGGTTGAQKKANRLPPAAADATLFAYRMPHGALDASTIAFEGESGGFSPNTISASTLSFHIDDFDATATETSAADLSADLAFDTVAVGESGAPTLEVCIPGVLGDATFVSAAIPVEDDDSAAGGDAGADSGQPGDALYYTAIVTKVAGSGQSTGLFTGMARATDPETGLLIGLDESLAPLPTAPEAVTYQAFPILMNNLPTATVALTSADPMNSGTSAGVSVTAMGDLDGDNLDVLVDWGDGGGFVTVASGLVGPAYPPQTPSGPQMNNVDLVTDAIAMVVRVTDGVSNVDFPLPYTLGANRAPVLTGSPALALTPIAPPATFTMNVGTATAVDPEGDAVTYLITTDTAPNGPFPDATGQAAFPIASLGPYPTPGVVAMTVHARDPLHGNTTPAQPDSTSTYAVVNATVQACPGLAYSGANLSGSYSATGANAWNLNSSNSPALDYAAMTNTSISPSGGVFSQATAPASNDVVIAMWSTAASGSLSIQQALNSAAAGLSLTRRINDMEVDPTVASGARVVFSLCEPTFLNGAGTYGPPAINYGATGAGTNFYYFDKSAAPFTPATSFTTVSTGANRVIAMSVDTNGDVFVIDANHTMHKYVKASAYAEQVTAPFPMDLAPIIGTNAGVGDANHKVSDFIINDRNKNFFILVVTQGPAGAPGNFLMYRVECDGVFNATIAGNPNPVRFVGNSGDVTQSQASDIQIDQRGSTGAILATQGEAQIMVSIQVGAYMRQFLNTNMQAYLTYNIYGPEVHMGVPLNNMGWGIYTGIPSPAYQINYSGTPHTNWQ